MRAKPKVSVIVLTYNPDAVSLKRTLSSIIGQADIDLEIIIADDGSKEKKNREAEEFMRERGFSSFKIADSAQNGGTVKNIANALRFAEGQYVKLISPGDYLYDSKCLTHWVKAMDEHSAKASFCSAVYYRSDGVFAAKTAPINRELFNTVDRKTIFENYLLANDTALGAALMFDTETFRKYISKMTGRVVYAEDFSLRLMIFDGITVYYHPENAIFYEYGEGVSTNKAERWRALIKKDFDETNRILLEENNPHDAESKKYLKYLSRRGSGKKAKLIKAMMYPAVVKLRRMMSEKAPAAPPEEAAMLLSERLNEKL